MKPQLRRLAVALMVGHVFFDQPVVVPAGDPANRGFKTFLAVEFRVHVRRADLVRHASRLRKIPLRVRHPRAGIHGVPHLLRREFQPGDVYHLEPVYLLRRLALAEVNHELVVEELPLDVFELPVEILRAEPADAAEVAPREIAVEVLAKRNRPLLAVHHLERAVRVLRPVHHIERESAHHG